MLTINEAVPGRNANVPRDEELDETMRVTEPMVQGVAPFVSPENPTREVAQRGANIATGNSQGVQSHVASTEGARNSERENGVSNSANPRSIESTGSIATNHSVATSVLLAVSVVTLGAGIQLESSFVSMASAVSIMTALSWASLGEVCSNMLSSFGRMLSYADEPRKRLSDLLKILGFKESEVDPFIELVGIETIAGIIGLQKEECMEALRILLIGDFRARRLSLGLCAFKQYYATFVKEKDINGKRVVFSNDFSVSDYNDDVHQNVVDNYSEEQAAFVELERTMLKSIIGTPPITVVLKEPNSLVSPFPGSQKIPNNWNAVTEVSKVPCSPLPKAPRVDTEEKSFTTA